MDGMDEPSVIKTLKKTFKSLGKIISENIYTFIVLLIIFITIKSFVTSYTFFTALSKANITRSSCGSIGLTEAETFRSLLLGSNINDYNKYIYVIVISIITVIVGSKLSEIISESCMNDFNINKDRNIIIFISIIFIFYVLRLLVVRINPDPEDVKSWVEELSDVNIGLNGGKLTIITICLIFFAVRYLSNRKSLETIYVGADNNWDGLTWCIFVLLLIDIILEITFFVGKIDKPEKFREFTKYDIFHDEIKLDIAVTVISIFIIVMFIRSIWKPTNNSSIYIFIGYLLLNLIIFLVLGSLEKDHVFIQEDSNSQYNIPIVTFVMFFFINSLILVFNRNLTEVYSIYFIILFILFIWYIFGTNFNTKSFGHYSLAYFHLLSDREVKDIDSSDYFNNQSVVEIESDARYNISKYTTVFNFIVGLLFLFLFIYIIANDSDSNKCNDIINKIITILIVYIIISYACGIFEIIFNDIFRLNDAAYRYKINLIKLNNEIAPIIDSTSGSPIKIDKQKILPFKTFTSKSEYDEFISSFDIKDIKNNAIEEIRQEIRNVHDKTISDYQEILDNNSDQKAYEKYLYKLIKYIQGNSHRYLSFEYFSIFVLSVPITLSEITSIYKQNGIDLGADDTVIKNLPSKLINDIKDNNIIQEKINKNYGYLYDKDHELVKTCIENVQGNKHQYLFYNKSDSISTATCPTERDLDILQSIDAKYFAASHLSYYPDQNNTMSIKKFKKYYDYKDNENDENIKKISKAYDNISTEVDKILVHERFYFLLVVTIILSVIVLMILFNLAKIYSSNNIYTPQMYAVGFLGVFIVIFIFAEVIIARIK